MKTTIIVIFVVLFVATVLSLVDAQCTNLVKQYYSCRHLKMIAINSTNDFDIRVVIYISDDSVANNTLDEAFFREKLDNLSLDDAVGLFESIYGQIDNCTSEFCQCVWSGVEDKQSQFGKIFAQPAMVEQIKRIVGDFNRKYELEPVAEASSLDKFCSLYSLTMEKLISVPDALACVSVESNSIAKFIQCALPLVIDANLKTILLQDISYLKSEKQEAITVCNMYLTPIATCPVEVQRFFAINILAKFSPDAFARVQSINSFSDSLMKKIGTYVAPEEYAELWFQFPSYWSLSPYVQVKNLNKTFFLCSADKTSNNVVLFNSSELKINASWFPDNEKTARLGSLDLTFTASSSLTFSKSLDFDNPNGPIADCSIKSSDNPFDHSSWIRIVSTKDPFYHRIFKVADLKTNSLLIANSNTLKLYAPISLVRKATGLLVDACLQNESESDELIENMEKELY